MKLNEVQFSSRPVITHFLDKSDQEVSKPIQVGTL